MATSTDSEPPLAAETRERPRAAVAAVVAALAIIAAALFSALLFDDAPRAWWGESAGRAPAPGALGGQESLQVPFYEYYDERSLWVIVGSVVRALGWLATGYVLWALAKAVLARKADLPKPLLVLPLVAGVASALATVLVDAASKLAVDDFLSGPRTVDTAQDVTATGVLVLGQFLGLGGALAASLAFVVISLNAMRVGLLTRFMGILGIIVGVLLIVPLGSPIPVVQVFWLLAVAVLLLGRWPGGNPPSWRTGRAEPWPSAAEVREQRLRGGARAPAPEPEPEPEAEPAAVPGGQRHPSSRKKKRRR